MTKQLDLGKTVWLNPQDGVQPVTACLNYMGRVWRLFSNVILIWLKIMVYVLKDSASLETSHLFPFSFLGECCPK